MTNASFESLVSAANFVTPDCSEVDYEDLAACRDYAHRNQQHAAEARRSIGPACAVPLRYTTDFYEKHSQCYNGLRNLAHVFFAEAQIAAIHNDHQTTIGCGLDLLNLSNSVRRGGLKSDMLVASSFFDIGLNVLRKIRHHLHGEMRQTLINHLIDNEVERESFATLAMRDNDWTQKVQPEEPPVDFQAMIEAEDDELEKAIVRALQAYSERPQSDLEQNQVNIDLRGLALLRLLAIELAIAEYQDRFGHCPEQISDLRPAVLATVPIDPFSDQNFVYRRRRSGFTLYSVGPNRIDNGGDFTPWHFLMDQHGDLNLDVFDIEWEEYAAKQNGNIVGRWLAKLSSTFGTLVQR